MAEGPHITDVIPNIPVPRKSPDSYAAESSALELAQLELKNLCSMSANDPNRTSCFYNNLGADKNYCMSIVSINGSIHLKLFVQDPQTKLKTVVLYYVAKQGLDGHYDMGIASEEFDIDRRGPKRNIAEESLLTKIAASFVKEALPANAQGDRFIQDSGSVALKSA